ncbi:MAG: radical SAM family heme chaperone HemW [Alphaproteobacteria bacterium]
MKTTSIYIHYPYCLSKCYYCDFVSFPCHKGIEDLTDFYLRELEIFHHITNDKQISSIYFGGGTPSLMQTETVNKIIEKIANLWGINKGIEITLEANPKTITIDKLKDLKSAGINRMSLGIQSLNDKTLRFLGRIHSSTEALQSLNDIRKIFDNVSADFIYAYPNQTLMEWEQELSQIKSLNLPHLSLYELIVEENTKLSNMINRGDFAPINENIAVDMFNFTNDFLKSTTPQYEISNYAKKGFESKHNINYWQGGDYIGIGPASASRITNDSFIINENPQTINEWKNLITKGNPFQTFLTQKERAEELIIMGLRQTTGINFKTFEQSIGDSFWNFVNKDVVENFQNQNLLTFDNDNIKVSRKGQLLLDTIILEIIK